ncbi:MAG: S8 family peptidase [Micromonosporaceae bacterium]
MRKTMAGLAGLVPLLFALAGTAHAAPTSSVDVAAAPGEKVAGQYLVTLKAGSSVNGVVSSASVKPLFTYKTAMRGFAARLSNGQLQSLRHHPSVAAIEQDQVARATATTQLNPPWGLDRIDQHPLPLNAKYTYTYTGYGVRAYVIDTGIHASHAQFSGRALAVFDSIGDGQNGNDCNGHGTHVAGTIGATTYGVAKRAMLRGVRVLNCAGSGSYAQVIAGVDWVTANAPAKSVANMSLGGGYSQALNNSVTAMVNKGIFTAVAAGNDYYSDACAVSPASASAVLTVGATGSNDAVANFSNVGSCVELFAPGVGVKSTWLAGGTNTISGTSMASPHAAGVAALLKGKYTTMSPFSMWAHIINHSTKNGLSGVPAYTPNRLLFKMTDL